MSETIPVSPIPVALIGGYLGAGKTTLVNRLLRQAEGRRLAVMVNDFGALPIDADLIEGEADGVIAIAGGCICCSYGSDLMAALADLATRQPRPDHVVIETSGVALPGAVAQSVGLLPAFAPDAIVVLADAESVRARGADRYLADTIARQLAEADLVLLNKADLVGAGELAATEDWLGERAPRARIVRTRQAAVPNAVVLAETPVPRAHAQPAQHQHHHHATEAYASLDFALPDPCDAAALGQALADPALGLLRAKGFARTPDGAMMTIQVVGGRWQVAAAPDGLSGDGRLVCIGLRDRLDDASLKRLIHGEEPAMADKAFAAGCGYSDGAYKPIAELSVSVLDWGFNKSDVTYDVVHVWHGGFFRLQDHLDRFWRSMSGLNMRIPQSQDEVAEILGECVRRTGLRDAYVAMVTTRGVPLPGTPRKPSLIQNRFLAYAIPWVDVISPEIQERGAHVIIAKTPRIPAVSVDPTIKNYHWGDMIRAQFEAEAAGVDVAVLLDLDGFVTEGPGFNVFAVIDGTVVSPDRGALEGITRRSVLELCDEMKIPCQVRPLPAAELRDADEVFTSTTAGGVMPVSRVDGRILANDRPGPVSIRLKEAYWQRHEAGWHRTPIDYGEGTEADAA